MTETGMIHMRLLISFSCPPQSAYWREGGREGGRGEGVKEEKRQIWEKKKKRREGGESEREQERKKKGKKGKGVGGGGI